MLNIIRQEHGKLVEELTYEHLNNLTSHGKKSNFKREENCLKWFFVFWLIMSSSGTFYANAYGRNKWIGLATRIQFLVICGTVFPTLMCFLYRYHRYEFNANKSHAWWFFGLFMLMQVAGLITDIYSSHTSMADKVPHLYCLEPNIFLTMYMIASNCDVTTVILGFCILNFKRNEDLLQGISKLDNILKVSIFQQDKQLKDSPRKESVGDEVPTSTTYRNETGESVSSSVLMAGHTFITSRTS